MILGSIAGILGGVAKDAILTVKEYKEKKEDRRHEIALENVRSENKIKEADAGFLEQKEKTKQSEFNLKTEWQKTHGIKAESDADIQRSNQKTEAVRFKALTNATSYIAKETNNKIVQIIHGIINIFIGTTRPIITYAFMYFVWHIYNTSDVEKVYIVTSLLEAFGAVVSFWFYDRGIKSVREIGIVKKKSI